MDLAEKICSARLGQLHLFYLGQAGYIIKSKAGTLVGIDLYLSDCVERAEGHAGFKRLTPKLLDPAALTLDYVLATHAHYDHFDRDAIPILLSNTHTRLFAATGCRRELAGIAEQKVTYIAQGDCFYADDVQIECVFCDHGTAAPDAVGLVIRADDKTIYVTGDTCLRLDKAAYFAEKGPFDVMIAPINGAFGNLNETECIQLTAALRPELVIPCHFGTFAAHGGDPGRFYSMIQADLPDQRFLLMAQGGELIL